MSSEAHTHRRTVPRCDAQSGSDWRGAKSEERKNVRAIGHGFPKNRARLLSSFLLHPYPFPDARQSNGSESEKSAAFLALETKLRLAAGKLHNNMDAAEYKHVVLGLIYLKYISDNFEEHRYMLVAGEGKFGVSGANAIEGEIYECQ